MLVSFWIEMSSVVDLIDEWSEGVYEGLMRDCEGNEGFYEGLMRSCEGLMRGMRDCEGNEGLYEGLMRSCEGVRM